MSEQPPGLLAIAGLRVELPIDAKLAPVVDGVSLRIASGESVGLVGESGSGKSMTARSIVRTLPPGARTSGEIRFEGQDVMAMDAGALRRHRTSGVGMIFQDPSAHTNPVRRIGDFLTEALRAKGVSRAEARSRAVQVLREVGITDERCMSLYPHELSGGMLQRVMIGSVLLVAPKLVLADEPTTALDVTTQAEIMAILGELRREHGMALLLITHDLELAASTCDRTAVMYAGTIVEVQPSAMLQSAPRHPYTAGLLASRPSLSSSPVRLPTIGGNAVAAFEAPAGCPFSSRCRFVQDRCREQRPPLALLDGGYSACLRAEELREQLTELARV
jgi:oligopeptide/dipeptide ABC transporter ATP-binding protein